MKQRALQISKFDDSQVASGDSLSIATDGRLRVATGEGLRHVASGESLRAAADEGLRCVAAGEHLRVVPEGGAEATAAEDGLHVAIIMDGNGRWAQARGLARTAGHRAGAQSVRRVVEAAPACGIGTLTLYAFSADNWGRPSREVSLLMRLLKHYLSAETERLRENGVRLSVVGRRDRLSLPLRAAIETAERKTAAGRALRLRLAVDYSAREAILRAAKVLTSERRSNSTVTREEFASVLGRALNDDAPARDVDLLIRTGGEQRVSDFLLWESAYAELYFTRRMWPDFTADDLASAVAEFHGRERRFGGVPVARTTNV
ncbi:MAG TPA: di-trans,poly-cis-decaprenylcistransferase [Pyrinomonadaceae bacterium]|nr:di-trans,poly-cis-decaprenylcistransferase [Pyrinomonadaceae bacterium]